MICKKRTCLRAEMPLRHPGMDKRLFKASDGGYSEAVVREDGAYGGLQQGPEAPVLVEQKVRPEAFPRGLPMSVGLRIYALSG